MTDPTLTGCMTSVENDFGPLPQNMPIRHHYVYGTHNRPVLCIVVFPDQFLALLYSLHCSRVGCFMGIILARCCLQIVSVVRT